MFRAASSDVTITGVNLTYTTGGDDYVGWPELDMSEDVYGVITTAVVYVRLTPVIGHVRAAARGHCWG